MTERNRHNGDHHRECCGTIEILQAHINLRVVADMNSKCKGCEFGEFDWRQKEQEH